VTTTRARRWQIHIVTLLASMLFPQEISLLEQLEIRSLIGSGLRARRLTGTFDKTAHTRCTRCKVLVCVHIFVACESKRVIDKPLASLGRRIRKHVYPATVCNHHLHVSRL